MKWLKWTIEIPDMSSTVSEYSLSLTNPTNWAKLASMLQLTTTAALPELFQSSRFSVVCVRVAGLKGWCILNQTSCTEQINTNTGIVTPLVVIHGSTRNPWVGQVLVSFLENITTSGKTWQSSILSKFFITKTTVCRATQSWLLCYYCIMQKVGGLRVGFGWCLGSKCVGKGVIQTF